MLENEPNGASESAEAAEVTSTVRRTRRRSSAAAAETADIEAGASEATATPKKTTRARKAADAEATPARRGRRKAEDEQAALEFDEPETPEAPAAVEEPPAEGRVRRRTAATFSVPDTPQTALNPDEPDDTSPGGRRRRPPAVALFQAPDPEVALAAARAAAAAAALAAEALAEEDEEEDEVVVEAPRTTRSRRRRRGEDRGDDVAAAADVETDTDAEEDEEDEDDDSAAARRRRRRGRRGRGRGKGPHDDEETEETEPGAETAAEDDEAEAGDGMTRRRRRRRRRGAGGEDGGDEEGVVTVVKIREPRAGRDEVQGVSGSTRLEAKRQRRRDGREQRRTRPAILSESEFLARREAVDRVMAIRQKGDRTQIAVLEDGVLVEHYVTRASSGSMVGNVYLGKVQNVLPSMEAAFVDIGRGRNAVLYAGEVNWDMAGLEGRARSIEQALRSGDSVLVQVTKDPIGHKGARLTSHIALSGRHLVYVPNGNASGISRKLSDVERKRLRDILKRLIPEGAGVIVRTAAEGASEEELERDVTRLQAQWADIEAKVKSTGAPIQLYEEPDLVIRVVRDLFNEDFRELAVQGADAYDLVENYLGHVSPDLVQRLKRHTGMSDIFATYRVDEQILKGLDRKVFLPSGGSLVIDRTEAMTVVDVNTGKYTGAGGNLEETVTRNNLEAAEEIVRQLRLRDIGGIIVIDFIDMVLESNRELVLRRLTECLGRDRTKHQVTEITSLGLVQMTRKRIGQGLLEAFSETCEHCKGRGVIMHLEPVVEKRLESGREPVRVEPPVEEPVETVSGGRRRGRRGRGGLKAEAADAPELAVTEWIDDDVEAPAADVELVEPVADLDEDYDDYEAVEAPRTPFVAPVVAPWSPPKTSSWVNLGAAPPIVTAPVVAEPAVAEPSVEESVAEEWVAEESAVGAPAVEEPAVEDVVVEDVVVDEPVAEEWVVEEPVVEAVDGVGAERDGYGFDESVEPVTAQVAESTGLDLAIGVAHVPDHEPVPPTAESVVFEPLLVESDASDDSVRVDLGARGWDSPAAEAPAAVDGHGEHEPPLVAATDGDADAATDVNATDVNAADVNAAEVEGIEFGGVEPSAVEPAGVGFYAGEPYAVESHGGEPDGGEPDADERAEVTEAGANAAEVNAAEVTGGEAELDALETEIEAEADGRRRRWRLRG